MEPTTYVYYSVEEDELFLVRNNGYNTLKVSVEDADLALIPYDKRVRNPLKLFDKLINGLAIRIGTL